MDNRRFVQRVIPPVQTRTRVTTRTRAQVLFTFRHFEHKMDMTRVRPFPEKLQNDAAVVHLNRGWESAGEAP